MLQKGRVLGLMLWSSTSRTVLNRTRPKTVRPRVADAERYQWPLGDGAPLQEAPQVAGCPHMQGQDMLIVSTPAPTRSLTKTIRPTRGSGTSCQIPCTLAGRVICGTTFWMRPSRACHQSQWLRPRPWQGMREPGSSRKPDLTGTRLATRNGAESASSSSKRKCMTCMRRRTGLAHMPSSKLRFWTNPMLAGAVVTHCMRFAPPLASLVMLACDATKRLGCGMRYVNGCRKLALSLERR